VRKSTLQREAERVYGPLAVVYVEESRFALTWMASVFDLERRGFWLTLYRQPTPRIARRRLLACLRALPSWRGKR